MGIPVNSYIPRYSDLHLPQVLCANSRCSSTTSHSHVPTECWQKAYGQSSLLVHRPMSFWLDDRKIRVSSDTKKWKHRNGGAVKWLGSLSYSIASPKQSIITRSIAWLRQCRTYSLGKSHRNTAYYVESVKAWLVRWAQKAPRLNKRLLLRRSIPMAISIIVSVHSDPRVSIMLQLLVLQ